MLIGAGVRASGGPLRALFAPLAGSVEKNGWTQAGPRRNFWAGQATVISGASIANKSGFPGGLRNPGSWCMAPKAGGMSSRFITEMSLTPTGLAVGGITTTGTASFVIDFALAAGGLIASGTGSAAMSITTNAPLLTASINGIGSASFSITPNTALLGAIADLTGSASFSLITSATILPANDASPLRTGTASFSFSGSLTPYAIGNMTGSTIDNSVLTSDVIASAVWTKAIEAGFNAEQILRIIAAHAAGAATGLEGANPQFIGLDGSTVRIDGAYSAGNRTIDALVGD